MPDTSPTKMALSMEQKEQAWSTWWASRPLVHDDGSQSQREKEWSVLREKKNWWFYTYGERYWTREDKLAAAEALRSDIASAATNEEHDRLLKELKEMMEK